MTTALRIIAGIFGALAGLLFHFNYPISGLFFSALTIASFLISLFTHRKEEQSQRAPLKIVFLDNTDVHKVKFEGKSIEWDKLISTLTSYPFFPKRLKVTIQSQGLDSFILIDLEKKKIINPPKKTSRLKTRSLALVHKDCMADLPIAGRAEIISKKYLAD